MGSLGSSRLLQLLPACSFCSSLLFHVAAIYSTSFFSWWLLFHVAAIFSTLFPPCVCLFCPRFAFVGVAGLVRILAWLCWHIVCLSFVALFFLSLFFLRSLLFSSLFHSLPFFGCSLWIFLRCLPGFLLPPRRLVLLRPLVVGVSVLVSDPPVRWRWTRVRAVCFPFFLCISFHYVMSLISRLLFGRVGSSVPSSSSRPGAVAGSSSAVLRSRSSGACWDGLLIFLFDRPLRFLLLFVPCFVRSIILLATSSCFCSRA